MSEYKNVGDTVARHFRENSEKNKREAEINNAGLHCPECDAPPGPNCPDCGPKSSQNDAHSVSRNLVEGRRGEWMHTSLGGRFFPADPRPEEVFISDIANGLALDCRYGGQGRVDRFYSVAEHSVHMAMAADRMEWPAEACLATLLHDAAEAYCNDLPWPVKDAVGEGYQRVEKAIQEAIWLYRRIYGLNYYRLLYAGAIKHLDRRMIPMEKRAIMRHQQPWSHDQYEPIDGVVIWCLDPPHAKEKFLDEYETICHRLSIKMEEGIEL